ncbi:MAG: hypothetical protein D3916_01820 [Candidatus Electrothrix sp. MAN1_4]|nr:hypothetical protein [Candidatus Electrothrix sp. MAN1_4]
MSFSSFLLYVGWSGNQILIMRIIYSPEKYYARKAVIFFKSMMCTFFAFVVLSASASWEV